MELTVGQTVIGRFPPWSFLRHAEVVEVSGAVVVVETRDGERHSRRVWSLRVAGREGRTR